MKVIVKTSGFYGGTWYDAGPKHQEMPEKVARQFLPPYSDQLVDSHKKQADAPPAATGEKSSEKKG
jgi:hypothetical protein